jgi:hypothetical protein
LNPSKDLINPLHLIIIFSPSKELLLFPVAGNLYLKSFRILFFLAICFVAEAAAKMGII